jgi:PAS domain S-box-containing protein
VSAIRIAPVVSEAAFENGLLASALAGLHQGVVITDPRLPDNPIIYANDAFLELTGYDHSEIIERNCRFLQGPGTDPAAIARLRECLATRSSFFGEILNYRKDGTPFWNALSIKPLFDAEGDIEHFVASQTDVTSLKELQRRIEEQQRLELLGAFAGGIAHDFNNVLLAALGHAELLAGKLEDPALRMHTARISEAAEAGRRLTAQLLGFGKGEQDVVAGVDATVVVAQTAAMAERLLPGGVRIELRLPGEPALVMANRSQLEQIILNLLVNSRDAIDGIGTIGLELARGDGVVTIAVSDTGSGIPPAARERIFETFYTTKAPGSGTGLGLATVHSIVSRLGGAIGLESEEGVGTTFTISLPVAPPGR